MPITYLHNQVCTELEKNILPFWQHIACDNDFGGYIGHMNLAGVIDHKADKSAIFTARILWAFSAAYQQLKNAKYLEQAHSAYCFFIEHFMDKDSKGVYQTLAYNRSIINDEKNIVAQAYAIYALSAYGKASGNEHAVNQAYDIFELIEANAYDKNSGSYSVLCTRQWQSVDNKECYRYTQVHLHLIEAYSELLSCQYNEVLALSLTALVELFISFMIDKNNHHIWSKVLA